MGQVDADHPWPTLPSEHPTLPRLVLELHDAVVEEVGRGGQVRRSASPAFARVLFSPLPVLATSNPDRLRELARNLDRMADVLADAHGSIERVTQP